MSVILEDAKSQSMQNLNLLREKMNSSFSGNDFPHKNN
jgi:hypothetical protein